MDLHNRCALITGAGSGRGRATALAFAHRGAQLALLDLDGAAAKATAEAAEQAGSPKALGIETDVADPSSVGAALGEADSAFGSVHVCVNAAGVPTAGKIVTDGEALPLDRFRSVIEVNLIGAFDVSGIAPSAWSEMSLTRTANGASSSTSRPAPHGRDRRVNRPTRPVRPA